MAWLFHQPLFPGHVSGNTSLGFWVLTLLPQGWTKISQVSLMGTELWDAWITTNAY